MVSTGDNNGGLDPTELPEAVREAAMKVAGLGWVGQVSAIAANEAPLPMGMQEAARAFIYDETAPDSAKIKAEKASAIEEIGGLLNDARASGDSELIRKLEKILSDIITSRDPATVRNLVSTAQITANSLAGKDEVATIVKYMDAQRRVDSAFAELEKHGAIISEEDKERRKELRSKAAKGDLQAIKELYELDSRILDDIEREHPLLKPQIEKARKEVESEKLAGEQNARDTEAKRFGANRSINEEKPNERMKIRRGNETAEAALPALLSSGVDVPNTESASLRSQTGLPNTNSGQTKSDVGTTF